MDTVVDPDALRQKIAWRVLPFVILLYFVAYLDRANVGFAKLAMSKDLKSSGFTEEVFGLGLGIFFIGYLFLEIPGALLVERWSARKWFARILISWGFVSALTAFVKTPMQFYCARFLLGVAEAGFFPGLIVYFTHWFPIRDRGRALAGLIMAVPFSLALGAPLSGLLLKINWLGLTGWKWLFILEGLPAVLLGVLTLFVLDDRPRDAKWLSPQERDWLTGRLDEEARAKQVLPGTSIWAALRLRNVWLLALGIFAPNTGGYAFGFWLPTMVQGVVGEANGATGGSNLQVLLWSGLIYSCGIPSMFLAGRSSDRTGERKWHCVAGQVAAFLFFLASAIPGQPIWLVLVWLALTSFSTYFWPPPFWALPTLTLTASTAAVSIGFINMLANLAGYLGNHTVGWLKGHGFGDLNCRIFLGSCYLIGAVFVALVRVPARNVAQKTGATAV